MSDTTPEREALAARMTEFTHCLEVGLASIPAQIEMCHEVLAALAARAPQAAPVEAPKGNPELMRRGTGWPRQPVKSFAEQRAETQAAPAAQPEPVQGADVVWRCNAVMGLMDDYIDHPTSDNRHAIRSALLALAAPAPQPEAQAVEARTVAATWRQQGEPDPHAGQYDCERAALTLGYLTDDELANGAFLNYDRRLDLSAPSAGKPGYHSPIVWMTAVKDRIRWLSRALESARAAPAAPAGEKP